MPDPMGSPAMWQDPDYEPVYGPADVYAAPAGSGDWTPQPIYPDVGQETLTAQGLVVSVISAVITTWVVLKLLKTA